MEASFFCEGDRDNCRRFMVQLDADANGVAALGIATVALLKKKDD